MTRRAHEPFSLSGPASVHVKARGAGATSLTLAFLALAQAVQRLTRSAQRHIGKQRRSRRQASMATGYTETPTRALAEGTLKGSRDEQRRLMLSALTELLDRHPSTREVMRPLALVELALRRPGAATLQDLSSTTVRAALAQLKGLVGTWSPALATLRSGMAAGVVRLEVAEFSGEAAFGGASAFVDDELPWTR
jgi:hypothetical protein